MTAVHDHEEVATTGAGHEPVVIESSDDHESSRETAYLRRSPENARRLVTTFERLEAGHGLRREIGPHVHR